MVERDVFVTVADGDQLNEGYFNGNYDTVTKTLDTQYGDSVLNGCLIEEQAVPDQTAQMSSGEVLVNGIYYSIAADASISFTNADATNPRYDLVSVDSAGTVTVTDGTAAATPSVPSLPADDVPLAVVFRAANDNVINNADIDDCRRLIGQEYQHQDNSEDTSSSNSYAVVKTVTVPAYRLQKYLEIEVDFSSYADLGPTDTSDASGTRAIVKITVEGVDELTLSTTWRYNYDGAAPTSVFSSSSGVGKIRLTDSDVSFTDNIVVQINLRGEANIAGSTADLVGTTNCLFVKGE